MAPNIRRIVTILWLTWVTGIANAQEVAKIESLGAEEFRSELRQLSEECHAAGNQQLADVVGSWFVPLPMGRQLVFAAEPGVQVADSELASRFMALRRQRAAALWQDAQSAAGAGEIERAYQLVFATFRENPQHVDAARLAKDAIAEIKLAPGRAKHKRLPWKAGDYWRATTTHFSISTNASQKDLRNVAQTLEQYHQLWRQVFVRHWSTIHAVRQALAGRALSPPTRRKHHVVVFKNRKDFIRFLKPLEPQIEIALGVYRNKDRTTYLYLGDEDLRQTWIHETTHQLFQETTSARHEVGADAHFWVVEGIAIYMESARWHNGYFTLGGFESPRLQIARYRRLNERFYVPLESLAQFGREELQRHPEIRRLYTQSAGLAHFFMDGQDASYREDFVRLISDLYRKSKRIQPLSARTEVASHRLDDQYLRFLDVTDSDLGNLPDVEKVENLALGHTQVTNRGLSSLAGADKVTWLDLAYLPVDNTGLDALAESQALQRLNLEGTQLNDQGVRRLGRFPNLIELDLSSLPITDESIRSLLALTNLQVLWLSNTQVGEAGVLQLAEARNLQQVDITARELRDRSGSASSGKFLPCDIKNSSSQRWSPPLTIDFSIRTLEFPKYGGCSSVG